MKGLGVREEKRWFLYYLCPCHTESYCSNHYRLRLSVLKKLKDMPIIVKDYTWEQTEKEIYISVPLKGTKASGSDMLCTEEYIKVNFPPFLFEAFLYAPIEYCKSRAKVSNGIILFTLHKKEPAIWSALTLANMGKEEMQKIRENAVTKSQDKSIEEAKAKAVKKKENEKYSLEVMMKIEDTKRNLIENAKEEEQNKATEELDKWKEKQRIQELEYNIQIVQQRREEEKIKNESNKTQCTRSSKYCATGLKHDGTVFNTQKEKIFPPTRSAGSIQVKFTPRVFLTALRESRVAEEEEWLHKQAEARRTRDAADLELQDLKDEEKNPEWLKDKGNKLFAVGDYLAAVNAFNLAIRINNKIPEMYLNRSACHLKLRNLHKTIEDTSKALELLTPPVPDNASARIKAHVRRGAAFCELELYIEGLQEYEAALKIDPANQDVKSDAEKIRQIIQGSHARS
ncbi:hypothetical protein GDO86_006273 [Hymenochirus boettgeri]|uniref:Dynein axonemal assembly factor 4 n=1 Tax=Hymenochirus boettgeri TaxID=247094 RepID=A0A8T2J5F9_9PIPI|nr:hypothetical protein GDO86_006273 [Hymenochirus boettgeri]